MFVTQRPVPTRDRGWTPDFSSAASFGALSFVFEPSERPSRDPLAAARLVGERLADFDPERDYLLWSRLDDPAALVAVCLYVGARFGAARLLLWERARDSRGERVPGAGYYVPAKLDFSQEVANRCTRTR